MDRTTLVSVDEYLHTSFTDGDREYVFGVPCVWVVNPKTLRGYVHPSSGSRECSDGVLRSSDGGIEVPLYALFG